MPGLWPRAANVRACSVSDARRPRAGNPRLSGKDRHRPHDQSRGHEFSHRETTEGFASERAECLPIDHVLILEERERGWQHTR